MQPITIERFITGLIFMSYIFSPIIGWSLFILLLKSRLWWFALLYIPWFFYDRKTPELGARPIKCIQFGGFWKYCKSYFNSQLITVPGFTLDPKRNYLFCCYPHGIMPNGLYLNMISGASDFYKQFPNFKAKFAVLHFTFFSPFVREIILGMGIMSCTAKAINSILSKPEGGNIVCLNPGGAVEAYLSRPGEYRCVVKKRRGFIKLAFKNGAPIVPVITFGESNAFEQIEIAAFRPYQEFVRRRLQFAPIVFYGTGFFTPFGVVPRKVPLNTVVGTPIEVRKTANPTNEEVDELHGRFLKELTNLFEKYKHQFLDSPNVTKLILE